MKAAQFEIEKQEALKRSAIDLSKTDLGYRNGQINGVQKDFEWTYISGDQISLRCMEPKANCKKRKLL